MSVEHVSRRTTSNGQDESALEQGKKKMELALEACKSPCIQNVYLFDFTTLPFLQKCRPSGTVQIAEHKALVSKRKDKNKKVEKIVHDNTFSPPGSRKQGFPT